MKVFHKIIDGIDDLLDYIAQANRSEIQEYCDIKTAVSNYVFVSKDGAVGTVIEIDGLHRSLTNTEFEDQIVAPFGDGLNPFFSKKGHAIQIYYSSDPEDNEDMISNAMASSLASTKNLGIDFSRIFTARQTLLKKVIQREKIFFVLWTTPEILLKDRSKVDNKNSAEDVAKKNIRVDRNSLDVQFGAQKLINTHIAFVEVMMTILSKCDIFANYIDVSVAFREMRKTTAYNYTPEDWQPLLPEDIVYPSVKRRSPEANRYSWGQNHLGTQLLPKEGEEITDKICRIGDYLYSPCFIDIMPQVKYGVTNFNALTSELNAKGFPWRVSILLTGDALSSFGMKKSLSRFLWFFNKSNNGMITRAIETLEYIKNENISEIAEVRINFATWAKIRYEHSKKNNDTGIVLDDIERQREVLTKTLQVWQEAQYIDTTGDPLDATLSSALGIKRGAIGTKMAVPVSEISSILPLNRPVSPWKSGGALFVSAEKKLFPFRAFSELQENWNWVIWAPPGSGKSFFLNYINQSLVMEEGNVGLPYLRMSDVGRSSFGVVNLIKYSLPLERQHEAITHNMRNTKEEAINPFTTHLGCREALDSHKKFLINFYKVLLSHTNARGEIVVDDGFEGLVTRLIDEMYVYYSDGHHPKLYSPTLNTEVHELLVKLGFPFDKNTTYWNVVDFLFKHNKLKEANIMHYEAMPILSDSITVLQESEMLKKSYNFAQGGTTEELLTKFTRMLGEVLARYPVLTASTKVDFSNARVIALDIEEMIKGSSKEDVKHVSVVSMLASYVLTKDFFVSSDEAKSTPAADEFILKNIPRGAGVPINEYRQYYAKFFDTIKQRRKRFTIDELHMNGGSPFVRNVIVEFMRTGRKYNVEVIAVSQLMKDFTEDMLDQVSCVMIMRSMEKKAIEEIKQRFSLSPSEEVILTSGLPPSSYMFLARFKMGKGYKGLQPWTSFRLRVNATPEEQWAYDTTQMSSAVRNVLYNKIGVQDTLKILSILCPDPSLIKAQERKIAVKEGESKAEVIANIYLQDALKANLLEQNIFA